MIMLGIWAIMERDSGVSRFLGGWSGGLWLAFIGWYLLSAAQETYTQVAIRNTLTGLSAADIMSPDVPTVARDISLEDYVQEVLRTGRRCHVVTGNGMAVGTGDAASGATFSARGMGEYFDSSRHGAPRRNSVGNAE